MVAEEESVERERKATICCTFLELDYMVHERIVCIV